MKKKKDIISISIFILTALLLTEFITSSSIFYSVSPYFNCKIVEYLGYKYNFYYCTHSCLETIEKINASFASLFSINQQPILKPCIIITTINNKTINNCKKVYPARGICFKGNSEISPYIIFVYNRSVSKVKVKIYKAGKYLIGVEL